MSKPWSHKVIALLALIQCVFGLLRAYNWVQIGTNLFGQGLLLLPFVGVVAVVRGLFVSIVALLYVLFAVGAFLGKSWLWWPGLSAALINLLLVFGAVVHGESLIQGLAWSAVPAILIFLYFSHRERTPNRA